MITYSYIYIDIRYNGWVGLGLNYNIIIIIIMYIGYSEQLEILSSDLK